MSLTGPIRAASAPVLAACAALLTMAAAPHPGAHGSGGPPPPPVRARPPIDWAEKPSGEDLARYYPERAARKQLAGKATIVCHVTDEGRLTDCKVASETPPGEGFGEAALKASANFRMRVDPGTNPAARSVRIPINFRLDGGGDRSSLGAAETAAFTKVARIATLGGLIAAAFAMLAWAGAALVARRGSEEPVGGDIVGVIGVRPSPSGSSLSGAAHLYPRAYRADGFLGGARGWFACLVVFLAALGATLIAAAVAVSGSQLDALGVAFIALFSALGLHAAWRLIVLFRSFVVLSEDAIEHQGLFAWRRIPRADIVAYRLRTRGLLPDLLLLKLKEEPRPVRIPILWHQDVLFEHWFDGLEPRSYL